MIHLSTILVDLLPDDGDAHALAALLHYAEARRPARLDATGMMVPLSLQDPVLWRRELIVKADAFLARAIELSPESPRSLQARLQACWCARATLSAAAPWDRVRTIYDELLLVRDDPVVRLNRIVAVAELGGAEAALAELDARPAEARSAYQAVLALDPPPAERRWLAERLAALPTGQWTARARAVRIADLVDRTAAGIWRGTNAFKPRRGCHTGARCRASDRSGYLRTRA